MPQFIVIKYIHIVMNAIAAAHLQNSSHLVKLKFHPVLFSLFYFPPPPSPWQPPFYFVTRLLQVPYISVVKQYSAFCDWLVSLSIVSPGFIRVGARVRMPFLFRLTRTPWYVDTTFRSATRLLSDTRVASALCPCDSCC